MFFLIIQMMPNLWLLIYMINMFMFFIIYMNNYFITKK